MDFRRKALIVLALGGILMSGCSKREAGEPPRDPGNFFPSYPCITCSDGTLYCSDVHKSSC